MQIRVITLRYDERLGGFPEDAVRAAMAGQEVTQVREYFFQQNGVAHLTIVLETVEAASPNPTRQRPTNAPDFLEKLPSDRRRLFLDLKRWRNQTAEKEKLPPFVVMRNEQLAAIAERLPESLSELREIDGIGEKTCASYGKEILAMIPKNLSKQSKPLEATCDPAEESSTK